MIYKSQMIVNLSEGFTYWLLVLTSVLILDMIRCLLTGSGDFTNYSIEIR